MPSPSMAANRHHLMRVTRKADLVSFNGRSFSRLGPRDRHLDGKAVKRGVVRSLCDELPGAGRGSTHGPRVSLAPNRNGGRHCCQPPLRRAKDLPVFVT
jgi:hypothetical protein